MKNATWLNIKTTMAVRKMKKPDDLTDAQWPSIKHVLDVMAGFANEEGDNIYPSYQVIAQQTGLNERTVYRAIAYLLKAKYLIKKPHYCLNLQEIQGLCPTDLLTQCQSEEKVTDTQSVVTDTQSVNGSDLLTQCQKSLTHSHHSNNIYKNTISKKQTTNTRALALLDKLLQLEINQELSESLLVEFGEAYLESHLNYFEVKRKIQRIDNPAAWLTKAIRENYAHASLGSVQEVTRTNESKHSGKPPLDDLKTFWRGLEADRKMQIYNETIKQVPSIEYLTLGSKDKLQPIDDGFEDGAAFKDLCAYRLRHEYLESLYGHPEKDFKPSNPTLPLVETPRQSEPTTLAEILVRKNTGSE